MVTTHNLGFPRISANRELKRALEGFWNARLEERDLLRVGREIRARHWALQAAALDWVPVGDFSLYDHVLDMSVLLGNVPERAISGAENATDAYFRAARGRSKRGAQGCAAAEMTKWFNSNYHFIVPEFDAETQFSLNCEQLLEQIREAMAAGHAPKPVLLGPLSYLFLGKSRDATQRLELLPKLTSVYQELLGELQGIGVHWLQLDEPILALELSEEWRQAFSHAYRRLLGSGPRLMVATYFGPLGENLEVLLGLPVAAIHLDAVAGESAEIERTVALLPKDRILSLGVVDGRNIWKTDLRKVLQWLQPIQLRLKQRLWLAPSCSLLHVPVDLELERGLDAELRSWLAFATQKLTELQLLAHALEQGEAAVAGALDDNSQCLASRYASTRTRVAAVRRALDEIQPSDYHREPSLPLRRAIQDASLALPLLPTTTIGSFPQTRELRAARRSFREGALSRTQYEARLQQEIARVILAQEELGLDVLVHGEPERTDMVEYFGGLLEGFALTEQGWVQSYGSRCVKPPILYGDVQRKQAMTVRWTGYAQSLTKKPVKGMLTGPVTLLNWSFVRDDQSRELTCNQLALAIREEVAELEARGTQVIQIDEAALREGMPLRRMDAAEYLRWAVAAFRLCSSAVQPDTQIHTHMCYSDFNEIMGAIANLDADVITIETSRSDGELLSAFQHYAYPGQIGPGVYDIHSPNIPTVAEMLKVMHQALTSLNARQLWVNPDCGLKTRSWEEVSPALRNLVQVARTLRESGMEARPS